MLWSEEAWLAAEPIYNKILELPFIKELSEGTLPRDKFMFYITQDKLYLDNYARVLAHVASRLRRADHMEAFLNYALGGVEMERALHKSFLGDNGVGDARPTPTCLLYNAYEAAKGLGPVEIEAASILPCFSVYQKVGTHILNTSDISDANPYHAWIKAYSDPYMEQSTREAVQICDELAAETSEGIRRGMTEAFVMATRMEWMFWDSAYRMEQWPV